MYTRVPPIDRGFLGSRCRELHLQRILVANTGHTCRIPSSGGLFVSTALA